MPSCIPYKQPGDSASFQATAAVAGKQFVKITAPRIGGGANGLSIDTKNVYQVGPCNTTGEAVLGVAMTDTIQGQIGGAYLRGSGVVVPITAGAAVTAGQEVQTDANGHAIPVAAGKAVGYALDSAAANADAEIHLY